MAACQRRKYLMAPNPRDTINIVASQLEYHWETPSISLSLYIVATFDDRKCMMPERTPEEKLSQ
jgi:hypothetical protein